MRCLLQFLGFASSTVFGVLLGGTLLTTPARAEGMPPSYGTCANCCGCPKGTCVPQGGGVGCSNYPCGNCTCGGQSVACT
jgi:hypothetical protein